MHQQCWLIALTVLTLAAPAFGQPARKERTPKDVPALVEALKGRSTRHQAYLKLMGNRPLPQEVAPALSKIVAGETGDTRTLAAALLAEITPKDAALVAPLSEGLATKDTGTVIAALTGLERLGPLARSALPNVLVAMESTQGSVRQAAVPAAASAGKDAIAPLAQIIRKAGETRKKNDQAATALGKIGPDATPAILKLFDMDDPEMDYHAAVALKSMDKKPPEALKPMLRLAEHKDYKIRRPVFDYLVAVTPPTEALNEVLWKGMDDENMIAAKCRAVMRHRTTDKAKWATALKKAMEGSREHGSLSILHEFYQLDREQAAPFMESSMRQVLGQSTEKWRLAVLATFEKELVPHMPAIYQYLEGTSKGVISSRINAITLLTHLPPEHTTPVVAKLQGDLKAARWELKLSAAQALLRTNPSDKAPIAKALAEVLAAPRPPRDFPYDEVLASLRSMGADGAAAVPALRIAQATARSDIKAKILLTMVALDPEQKAGAIAIAEKMHQDAKEPFAGAAVLLELGAIAVEDALKTLAPGLESSLPSPIALRAIEIVGPKVKALTPKLEAALGDRQNPYRTQTVLALARIDGNTKLALERLIQLGRDDPMQFGNVAQACARFGPSARSVVPDLVKMAAEHQALAHFHEALTRIDPSAFFLVGE